MAASAPRADAIITQRLAPRMPPHAVMARVATAAMEVATPPATSSQLRSAVRMNTPAAQPSQSSDAQATTPPANTA
jgi:hypothetical protein